MVQLWSALLYDSADSCDIDHGLVSRDYERLVSLVSTRGLGFLTLDLPSADNSLLQTLESGKLSPVGHLMAHRTRKSRVPRFLNAFWRLVIDENGCLLPNPNAVAIGCLRQLFCAFKKVEVTCSNRRIEAAVKEFYDIEQQIRPGHKSWNEDEYTYTGSTFSDHFAYRPLPFGFEQCASDPGPFSRGFLRRLDFVSAVLVSELGRLDIYAEDSVETGWYRHGQGAVSDKSSNEYKYSFESWPAKLEGEFPFDWCATGRLGSYPSLRDEHPSRLAAVPKTAKAPRLIASEPSYHQWCQQKLLSYIDTKSRSTRIGKFVDFHNQKLSQLLVAQSSQNRSLSTLDLSSASDRVTTLHVECLFRSNPTLLSQIHACRTRTTVDGISDRGIQFIKKFATMGSALTFPLQSIFFLAVALASAGASTKEEIDQLVGKVRVFGDDIIVPTTSYDDVVLNLTSLGLRVNSSKSFTKGNFRESCGMDCFDGVDVTPVKPKVIIAKAPVDVLSLLDTSNNFHKRLYWRAAEVIRNWLPPRFRGEAGTVHVDEGFALLQSFVRGGPTKTKWDPRYQSEYASYPNVLTKRRRKKCDNASALVEFFTRPYRWDQPRETGVLTRSVAVFATGRRVPLSN